MATLLPILPTIANPCSQSWEEMPGTARVRHCAACNQDVVNTAALSSAEIARLLKGPLPCLRIARFDDGTLVTTEPAARPLPRIAAGLLTAAMALSSAAAQNQRSQQVLLGAPPAATAEVAGLVTGGSGHPLAGVTATLLHNGKVIATVKLGPDGRYAFSAPTAGRYDLRVEAPESAPRTLPVQLTYQKPLDLPVQLAPRQATMGMVSPRVVTLGKPALPHPK